MLEYKLFLNGSDRHATFCCEHCAVSDGVELVVSRGRVVRKPKRTQPGLCPSCRGTKKDERNGTKRCQDCGGSGVCPECNGSYMRTWNELSDSTQSRILTRLEHGEALPSGYESASSLLREY